MRFGPVAARDKSGRSVILRNAELTDAEELIHFMKIVTAETPYLIREPGEFSLTPEAERAFLQGRIDAPDELFLIATVDGRHAGNCSLMRLGSFHRYRHRCELAIALYQEFCGAGIGRLLLQTVLSLAKQHGYEQAELEVIEGNASAIALYEKLGFQTYGTFPRNMKYADGHYADARWMMRPL